MAKRKNLKISLTKFGYHKLAYLLMDYDTSEILNHLDHEKDKIDIVQAKKILSSYYRKDNKIPKFWNKVKELGQQDIRDLIFYSIILSHNRLIDIVSAAFKDNNGRIYRDNPFISIKEYTNFARTVFELGFIVEEELIKGNEFFTLDVSRLYYKFYLPSWILELVNIKALDAGWDESTDILNYIKDQRIHLLFNLSYQEFKNWIKGQIDEQNIRLKKGQERKYKQGLKFKSGHSPKYEGKSIINQLPKERTVTLIHNRLQTKIYHLLIEEFPEDQIGTEVQSNNGSIDIVRISSQGKILYELKTSNDIKTSIRKAFGQIMEYAYWSHIPEIHSLIIISPAPVSKGVIKYLKTIREQFRIPLFYQHFDEKNMNLSKLY